MHTDMLGHVWKCFINLNAMVLAFFKFTWQLMCLWFMSCVERNRLELLRKTVANNEQPQSEEDYEKVLVERLLKGL